jgi:hypothetical protein
MKTSLFAGIAALALGLAPFNRIQAEESANGEVDPFAEEGSGSKHVTKPDSKNSRMVRVQVEFIEVSLEQFTDLMFGAKPAANDTELRKQLDQLIKHGKANIIENLLCTCMDAQKATTESIEEYIYPTEYEPAELPLVEPKKEGETPKIDREHVLDALGPTPTAFETRNLGPTLEIEPKVSEDGKTIDLRFVPEIVYHVGNNVWAEWKGKHGNSPVQMPTFYTVRCNTAVTLANGRHALAAALSPKDENGKTDPKHKLMVFVRANVFSVGQ